MAQLPSRVPANALAAPPRLPAIRDVLPSGVDPPAVPNDELIHVVAARDACDELKLQPEDGSGLNPYFILLNERRRSTKKRLGRKLSPAEMTEIDTNAHDEYEAMSEEAKAALRVLHLQGVEARQFPKRSEEVDASGLLSSVYASGLITKGCREAPFRAKHFCQA